MGMEDKCGSKDREGGDWEESGDPGRESGGLTRDLFGGRCQGIPIWVDGGTLYWQHLLWWGKIWRI